MARRMGGAGMRRGLRGGSGVASATADVGFARSDLGMLAGFDPDAFYIAQDGSNRVSLMQARWAYTLAGAATTYDVRQATGSAQPLYEATGVLGKPSLYYTTDDFMATADAILANLLDGAQALTVYLVADRDTSLKADGLWALSNSTGTPNHYFHHATTAGGVDQVARRQAGPNVVAGSQTVGTAAVRLTVQYNGATMTSWVGDVSSVSAADVQTPVCDRLYLGVLRSFAAFSTYLTGRMGHLLFYQHAHDAAQRAYVWGLLQAHYPGLA